jgi:hypothetical protein
MPYLAANAYRVAIHSYREFEVETSECVMAFSWDISHKLDLILTRLDQELKTLESTPPVTDLDKLLRLLDAWHVAYWMETSTTWVRVIIKQAANDLVMGDRMISEADVVFEFERTGEYRTMGAYE